MSKRKQAEKLTEPTCEPAENENEPYYSLKRNTLSNTNTYADDDLISIAKQAIRATFIATKRKALRNIAGYFNGVLNRKLDELLYATMATQYDA